MDYPAALPPTKLNFLRYWWSRSSETATIAESRLLSRLNSPVLAQMGKVWLDARHQINTLSLTPAKTFELTQGLGTAGPRNLVFCHGYGAGLGFFYRNLGSLCQADWKVFAIDWIGMGNSSRPNWEIKRKAKESWKDLVQEVEDHFVESLEGWRKAMKMERMTLVGHSLGGYFSVCYASRYPERVEKLILVSPAGVKEMGEVKKKLPGWAVYLWDRNITPFSIVRALGPIGAGLVQAYTAKRFSHLELSEQHDLYDYIYHISASEGSGEYALAAILAPGAYARIPLTEKLKKLTMPTVFIYGEHDWMDYTAAEKVKEEMKVPVKIIRIPGGGHHMYIENPTEFNKVIQEELK